MVEVGLGLLGLLLRISTGLGVRDRAKFRVRIVDRFRLQLGIKLMQELQLELEVRLVLDLV